MREILEDPSLGDALPPTLKIIKPLDQFIPPLPRVDTIIIKVKPLISFFLRKLRRL
jgi:hypothetical protein